MAMWDPKLLIGQLLLCRLPPQREARHIWHSCVITQTVPPRVAGDSTLVGNPPAKLITALMCRYSDHIYGEIPVKYLNDNKVVRPHPVRVSHGGLARNTADIDLLCTCEQFVKSRFPSETLEEYVNRLNPPEEDDNNLVRTELRTRSRSRRGRLFLSLIHI